MASQGKVINFPLSVGYDFSFSLDTRSKAVVNQVVRKKKPSPSTLRRNAKRREQFLAKKRQKSVPQTSSDSTAAEPKCDQCDYVAASEKGLRQHIRIKHKDLQPEKLRKSSTGSPLAISPIKDQRGGRSPSTKIVMNLLMYTSVLVQMCNAVAVTVTSHVTACMPCQKHAIFAFFANVKVFT